VLTKDGEPRSGPIEVVLTQGEFDHQLGDSQEPPTILRDETDAFGLTRFEGELASEVVRFEVRTLQPDAPDRVADKRGIRFVSFAGAVQLSIIEPWLRPGVPVEVQAYALRRKKPVFVDVFDPRGTFIDVFTPPFVGAEPPRPWIAAELVPGIYQFQGDRFVGRAGEATAVARAYARLESPPPASMGALIDRHREIWNARPESDAVTVERNYLERIESWMRAPDQTSDRDPTRVSGWLLGTLPTSVFDPPTALHTLGRDREHLAARQRTWRFGLRWFLLGGGGLFLLLMTLTMIRDQRRDALRLQAALESAYRSEHQADEREEIAAQIAAARQAAFARGIGLVAVMAGGLVLTTVMLEKLLVSGAWQ
jgi:hypothetical protein